MMNPQILIDAVEHKVRGHDRDLRQPPHGRHQRLQLAQYDQDFRTNDHVAVDYVRLAAAVSGVLALSGGDNADTLRAALQVGARPCRPLGRARAGL